MLNFLNSVAEWFLEPTEPEKEVEVSPKEDVPTDLISLETFTNFFKYYNEESHQKKGVGTLFESLPAELKRESSEWVLQYRNQVEKEEPSTIDSKVLDVKYFSQRDNYRDANRTCFSSACAMLLEYMIPPAIVNDDDYIREVYKRGDSTNQWVQLSTLKYFGLDAEYVQTATNEDLKKLIDNNIPVPCGILHQGPEHSPSGGGHWITVVGYDDKGWFVNDPWGSLHHPTGTYVSTNGDLVHYSYELMDARWTVDGNSDGWCIIAKEPKEEYGMPSQGIELIKEFEGFHDVSGNKVYAYPDPGTGGKPWTIGWGSTRKSDGSPFYKGDSLTFDDANKLFEVQLENNYWSKISKTVPYWDEMNDNQRSALLSFAYNLGASFYGSVGFETISRELREKDWKAVPDALMLYVNGANGPLPGLVRRREAEGDLWNK